MVYRTNDLVLCHELTPLGKKHYREFLEREADYILWKNEHPWLNLWQKIKELF